jgi:predicted permease
MQTFLNDLRYTLRELRKRPTFTLTAILSLALGIAATTAVFSVIYAVLIDPFPYPGSDRLVELTVIDQSGNDKYPGFSGPEIQQLRGARTIESVTAEDGWNLTTTDGDIPEDVQASYLSPEDPNHWGVKAMLGRWMMPSDAPVGQEPQPVVVLGYKFWQRYYMGDPSVIGRKIQLVHKPYEIIGVMPPRFRWRDAEIYLPQRVTNDPHIFYGASIKIRPGVSPAQAEADLQPYLEQFAKDNPAQYPDVGKFRAKLRNIIELYAMPIGPTLYLLLGAVTSLLLIGCGNVSILLLARGAERQQEFAVRSALGADRLRMVRQLLTESLAIALAGTSLGVLFAWRGLAGLVAWLPNGPFPAEAVIKINLPVLFFCIGLAFSTALVFGLSPALQLSRPDIARLMQGSGRRVHGSASAKRTHRVMVAAQVALTLLLLTVASAAGKGFLKLVNADLGYDPRNTMSLPIPVHENTYPTLKTRAEYFEQIRSSIAAMPQVMAAGISTNATPPANGNDSRFEIFGSASGENPECRLNFISPEYFDVLHIPLAQGRLWDHAETMRSAPLVVINETLARQFFPKGDAIGQQVKIPDKFVADRPPYSPASPNANGWLQIIGIVKDVRNDGLRNPIKPSIYVPYTLSMRMFTQILVRTRVAPLSILHDIRARLVQIDREQQVMQVRDLNAWITGLPEYSQQRFMATLFAIFSVLALVLAAVGLYSVVSYGVATRTNEFGIRMALGARGSDVFRMVLSSTAVNVGAGVIVGIFLSVAFNKVSTRWVMESSRNPWILVGVTLVLLAAAALACFVPARRASSIDPMEALRYE